VSVLPVNESADSKDKSGDEREGSNVPEKREIVIIFLHVRHAFISKLPEIRMNDPESIGA
jgi:hypothetical protein